MKRSLLSPLLFLSLLFQSHGQQAVNTRHFNLAGLLGSDSLEIDTSNHAAVLQDPVHSDAITLQRIAWLKNVSFKNGVIDVDLRGKDVFLQSFLGIAFHGKDSTHYELIYFRPFNFQDADVNRRKWSVQYVVNPEFPWDTLRAHHPLVYENAVTPVPRADAWFHASIAVDNDSVRVFVNHATVPSLVIKRLSTATDGKVGLWDDELSGDFANLTIKQ